MKVAKRFNKAKYDALSKDTTWGELYQKFPVFLK
jgi:hypothetical protein